MPEINILYGGQPFYLTLKYRIKNTIKYYFL
jgi:hypothetical protein